MPSLEGPFMLLIGLAIAGVIAVIGWSAYGVIKFLTWFGDLL